MEARLVNGSEALVLPEVVTLDQVPNLGWDEIVLGTGVCYLKGGEAMKVCPYSLSVEMAMVEMGVKYKLIYTHLVGLSKEPWFVALHPKGKPSSPFLWSHGRWIFDTLPILDELMKRFPDRNHESIMPFKDHMKARSVYKGAPINKLSETVDDSADHYKYRMKTTDMLRPFVDRLRDNKFLGGDKISFSDCHFCQQLGNGRQLIEYLKKIDLIEENEILRAYWDRLTKMKCFRIGRGSYAIRVSKEDVYDVERQYSKQLAEWCRDKWNMNFPNLQKVIMEDEAKSGSGSLSGNGTEALVLPEVVTLDQVPNLGWDEIVLGTGVCYLKGGEAMKVCPYSLSVEMAMVEMGVKYKLIYTHLVGLSKEPWFVALHPKGKPSSPFLWSHGRWIFDTLPILDELMKRFPDRNHESVMPFKDHMKARSVYKGAPINKLSETVDDSADHYKYRMKTTDMLRPFVDRLRDNKFLGGDKISFSDCHFCQQLGNGRQLIEYLKKIDLIEENEILRAYWDRLTKMKCFRIGRGSYAIRVSKEDVYDVERQYSKQLAEWCRDKWNMNFPNLQKVIMEDEAKSGGGSLSGNGTEALVLPEVVTLDQVPNLGWDEIVLGTSVLFEGWRGDESVSL